MGGRPELISSHKTACLSLGKSTSTLIPRLKDSNYTASLNHKKARELDREPPHMLAGNI